MLEKDGTKKTIFLDSLKPAPHEFLEFGLAQHQYAQSTVSGCQEHVMGLQKVRLSKLQFALHQRLSLPDTVIQPTMSPKRFLLTSSAVCHRVL